MAGHRQIPGGRLRLSGLHQSIGSAGDNDLATTHPHLARQWHAIKNAPLTPWAVTAGAHRKVWWRCDRGHEWQAAIFSRTVNTTGCPVCAGRAVQSGENDLQTLFPGIAAQWHPDRNGTRTPDTISPCSNRKVWWVCEQGHPYPAVVAARTMHGSGCPYCAGRRALPGFNDLTSAAPNVAAQWHPTLNGSLTPEMITAAAARRGVVALSGGARLAGRRLLPHRKAEERLPGVRGQGEGSAAIPFSIGTVGRPRSSAARAMTDTPRAV